MTRTSPTPGFLAHARRLFCRRVEPLEMWVVYAELSVLLVKEAQG